MYCSNCGAQLLEGAKFCAGCGKAATVVDRGVVTPPPQVSPTYTPPAPQQMSPTYTPPPQASPVYTQPPQASPAGYPRSGYAPSPTDCASPGYAQATHVAAPVAEKLSGGAKVGMFALGFFLWPIGVLVAWLVKKGTSVSKAAIKLSLIGFAVSFALACVSVILSTVITAGGSAVTVPGGGNEGAVTAAEPFADHGYRLVSCELTSCGDESVMMFVSPADDDMLLVINDKLLGTGTMANPDSTAAQIVIKFETDESFSGDVSFRLIKEGAAYTGEAADVQFAQGANVLAAVVLTGAEVNGEYTVEALIDGKLIFSDSVSVTLRP